MASVPERQKSKARQRGTTLIETMIAAVVLVVGFVSTMSLFSVAVIRNSSEGEVGTLVTEYAQDKMEQLMALNFTDSGTNTTVSPTQATGGTGLGGSMAGNQVVGSVGVASPSTGYVDYLDRSGNLLSNSTGAYFVRQWSIATNATANLKTISVRTRVVSTTPSQGAAPDTTLVCSKASL